MKRLICIYLIIIIFSTGCNINGQNDDQKPFFIGSTEKIDETDSDVAKQIVYSMDEVVEVKGVNVKKDIYIAVKVGQFDRLFLDRIRKKAHDKVKKRFPKANVHVSTDKKVFMELETLEKKINQNKLSKKKIDEKIKEIEGYMKG